MPVSITPHLDFEALLGGLLDELDGLPKVLKPHPVVIPSIPFSDHLRLAIARKRGICMGLEFLTPSGFINRVTGGEKNSHWSRDQLAWRILPHANHYAEKLGIDPATATPRDCFAISQLLADRFDQYGHFRPGMIRDWSRGKSGIPADKRAEWESHEEWQRELCSKLIKETPIPHPAIRLEELAKNADSRGTIHNSSSKLTVIGSGTLDPLLVEVLQMLACTDSEISLHILLPTKRFLEEMKTHHREQLKDSRNDPEEEVPGNHHPLLASMGRHAVGTFQLLGKLDDNYNGWPDQASHEAATQVPSTLLQHLQGDIRALQAPPKEPSVKADDSISIHACFGPRREMEVLRDQLLGAFEDFKDLKPEEIHIITPSLDAYAPLVQATLEGIMPSQAGRADRDEPSEPFLGVRVTETTRAAQDPATIGLLSLLEMASEGRHEASWVMELLHLKAVQEHLGIKDDDDLEKVRSWVKLSGLTRGIDAQDHADPTPSTGSWGFALNRLLAGAMMGDAETAIYPDDGFVLPVSEDLGTGGDLFGKFTKWMSALEQTMVEWKETAVSSAWAERLKNALNDLLGCGDGGDLKVVPHLRFLRDLDCKTAVDAAVILDWLDSATGEERRQTQASGKTSFGRFKHLQNLPCRVLAMVGMQDSAFPARNRTPAWDLLQASLHPWDRNPRIDDRQLFLDALLTPTDRLIITAPTLNVRTNKEEPFSSCVDEFIRLLEQMGADREGLIRKHRLQPFSPVYFADEVVEAKSYSGANAAVANAIAEVEAAAKPHPLPFWDDKAREQLDPAKTRLEITLKELIDFWRDPARGFVKSQGVLLPRDEEDDSELDRPPTTLDNLESWSIQDEIMRALAFGDGEPNLELIKARLSADRKLPPGELGEKAWDDALRKVRPVAEAIKAAGVKKHPVSCTVTIQPTDLIPELTVTITGEVFVTEDESHLVSFQAGKLLEKGKPKPKHHIGPFISAIISAHDRDMKTTLPTQFFGQDHVAPRTLRAMLPADFGDQLLEAVTWLRITNDLVTGYLEGRLRPVCYAAETSNRIVELMKAGPKKQALPFDDALLDAIADKWHGDDYIHGEFHPREGGAPGALLAWRDRNEGPFPGSQDDWQKWTDLIAKPLNDWANSPQ